MASGAVLEGGQQVFSMNGDSIRKIQSLLQQVQIGDKAAGEILVSLLRPGVAFFLSRSVRSSDVGSLTEKVLSYILETAQLGVAKSAQDLIRITLDAVHGICGEQVDTLASEARVSHEMMANIAALPNRTREVLHRYYALAESSEDICTDMSLSREDFQRMKDEGKTAIGRHRPGEG